MTPRKTSRYEAVVGLTMKNGDRIEPGDLYPGRPAKWLIEQGKVRKRG